MFSWSEFELPHYSDDASMYRPLGLRGNRNYLSCLSGFVIELRVRGYSKLELHVHLHAARRIGSNRLPEEWG